MHGDDHDSLQFRLKQENCISFAVSLIIVFWQFTVSEYKFDSPQANRHLISTIIDHIYYNRYPANISIKPLIAMFTSNRVAGLQLSNPGKTEPTTEISRILASNGFLLPHH